VQQKIIESRSNCNPKAKKILELEIEDSGVDVYKEYMQEHAVVCKFMCIWPTDKALNWYPNQMETMEGNQTPTRLKGILHSNFLPPRR